MLDASQNHVGSSWDDGDPAAGEQFIFVSQFPRRELLWEVGARPPPFVTDDACVLLGPEREAASQGFPKPLIVFAGIWTPWTPITKVREGETTNNLFRFLTTEPDAEVGALHPKAMPVIWRTPEEIDLWMTAPAAEALTMQKPLPDGSLTIVARGKKEDNR